MPASQEMTIFFPNSGHQNVKQFCDTSWVGLHRYKNVVFNTTKHRVEFLKVFIQVYFGRGMSNV